jgi:hypothetical protein
MPLCTVDFDRDVGEFFVYRQQLADVVGCDRGCALDTAMMQA